MTMQATTSIQHSKRVARSNADIEVGHPSAQASRFDLQLLAKTQ